MNDFILDLDAYFCERYEGYDKLSVLPGYKMPLMQRSEVDDFGRTRTFTLPANTMRLATQEKKVEILQLVKEQAFDRTFSFSFVPYSFFRKIGGKLSKHAAYKYMNKLLKKYDFTNENALELLNVEESIWSGISKGKYAPTKNFLFSLALAAHMSYDDTVTLLGLHGYEFDYAIIKDVVVSYLLSQKVFNPLMVEAALKEYKVENLFLKA